MRPYSAYLRVYEPLAAFPEPALAAWTLYSDPEHEPPDPEAVLGEETRGTLGRVAATPPVPIPDRESDQALVRRADDMTYVCPLDTRLRSVLAYASLDGELPTAVLRAALPPEARARAEDAVGTWRAGGAPENPHVRESRWHVPMPWFLLFRPAERRLVLVPGGAGHATGEDAAAEAGEGGRGDEHDDEQDDEQDAILPPPAPGSGGDSSGSGSSGGGGGAEAVEPPESGPGRTLSYVTRMAEARRRLARALAVLRKTVEGTIVGDVETLGRWLEEFHPHSLVELDYAGLVELVDDGFLVTDRSVADVAEGVAALSAGDAEAAARHYRAVVGRWIGVERCESAN